MDELIGLAVRLAKVFSGRDDAHGYYGKATIREHGGKRTAPQSERRTVREPVTVEKWVAHLSGDIGLGIVPIRTDNTVSWGAIDIDSYGGFNHAALAQQLKDAGLPLIVCTSKSGGAHVFAFVGTPVPAAEMQAKLRDVCQYLGLSPGTEIFPKQTAVLAGAGDVGNWLNMPYQELRSTARYAIKPDGRPATLEEFLTAAETVMQAHHDLSDLVVTVKKNEGSFSDAPPCLEYLTQTGFAPGSRNNGLFNLAVYARKAYAGKWKAKVREYNEAFFRPPLETGEVDAVISSAARKDYVYRCTEEPIRSCCNKMVCRTREHGIGAAAPIISHISKIESDPPIWLMDVDGVRIEFDRTQDWMEQSRFGLIVTEKLHRVPARMKDPAWREMWNTLLTEIELVPAPPEASTAGEFYELLNLFAERPAQNREQLLLGLPFHDEGHVWFSLSDLQNFMHQHDFKEYERRHVLVRLRALSAAEKQIKVKGKVLRVWGVPATWFNVQTETFSDVNVDDIGAL
ncbi:Primase, C-terminal 1 [uncultured Caudovirales phage]|uniref:Primase, C-terminal 1 n=1 Tax=uncultured Caudovirales phage TaxID=2100421 RepID=A0A6J5REA1_9CAUD|nr:Primase, C-terminal 1 [uncultured Caudovirales phage]CAB4205180.1 Primase, C-terminal 1 [uncultured Caudovirales phage]